MIASLIEGQELIDSFIFMLPTAPVTTHHSEQFKSCNSGVVAVNEVPTSIKNKLSQIFFPNPVADHQYRELFYGDISRYGNNHSSADIALVGYFAKEGLTAQEADLAFRSSKLYRHKWEEMRGNQTYGEMTIGKVFNGSNKADTRPASDATALPNQKTPKLSHHSNFRPVYEPNGMPARKFVGPSVCIGTRLFPANAMSALAALGGTGKTSVLLSIAAHIAAGKSWNGSPLKQQKVAMFFCEETHEEIIRKFSATIDGWSKHEQTSAIENLLLVPLLGVDARLTTINKGNYSGSGFAEEIIEMLSGLNFNDGLIIFDHLQGFTSGDLNVSETATALSREGNKIVDLLGVAVVFAAHISKSNINTSDISQGFIVGSLAFENAVRQSSGMRHMSNEEAKKYGVEEFRKDYVWLGIPKNNYGNPDDGVWLQKKKSTKYHTVTFEPINLIEPISPAKLTENERLEAQIISHIKKHPFTTKNMLDGHAGTSGIFRVGKGKLRDALRASLDAGLIREHVITEEERVDNNLPKQVKNVLRPNESMPANTQGR